MADGDLSQIIPPAGVQGQNRGSQQESPEWEIQVLLDIKTPDSDFQRQLLRGWRGQLDTQRVQRFND